MSLNNRSSMSIGPNQIDPATQRLSENISHLCWPSYQRTTTAVGGDGVARFTFPVQQYFEVEQWLENRLGWHFEEWLNGKRLFAGYISNVRVMWGGVMFYISMNELYNDVIVLYKEDSGGVEAGVFREDAESIARYGRHRQRFQTSQFLSLAGAVQVADSFLREYAQPRVQVEGLDGGSAGRVEVEVRGYTWTLDWGIVTEVSTAVDTQAAAILTAYTGASFGGQFLTLGRVDPALSGEIVRETDTTGWQRIKEIVGMGSPTGDPIRVGAFGGQELTAEVVSGATARYLVRIRDGRQVVTTADGGEVEAAMVEPGRVAFVTDAMPGKALASPLLDDARAFFIDSVSYSAAGVKLHNARATVNTRALIRAALQDKSRRM